jgi:integrase
MPVITLTQQFIDKQLAAEPGSKRTEHCDSVVPGLYAEARANSSGLGTYYLRYKDAAKKTCHYRLGTTNELTLSAARKQASQLKADIARGIDPREGSTPAPLTMTLKAFLENHYLPYVRPRKRSAGYDEQMTRKRIVPSLGNVRLDQLSRLQIQQFHTDLKAEGLAPATCDHHLKMLRHAFNLAVDWDMLEKNPAAKVPLYREDNRKERYMNDEELARLLTTLKTTPACNACGVALFLLSTGARLNEALQATWDQVDIENRVWRIPAQNSKSKKPRSVPLNDTALEVLDDLGTKDISTFLFINHRTGKPLTCINRVWERLRQKAELPHLRIHDLRHQYASMLVNSGRSLYEVQQILGHSDPSVTQRYAHLSSRSLQEAANSASLQITNAGRNGS